MVLLGASPLLLFADSASTCRLGKRSPADKEWLTALDPWEESKGPGYMKWSRSFGINYTNVLLAKFIPVLLVRTLGVRFSRCRTPPVDHVVLTHTCF